MKKLFFAIFGVVLAQSVFAVNPVPYTLGVSFSFRLAGTGTGLMTVYDEVGTPVQSLSTSGTTTESGISLSWMKPGKEYFVNLQGSGASEYWLSFITPTGYQLWVDGFPRDIVDYVTGGGSYNTTRSLVLRPIGGGGRMNAGAFSGIDIGKAISWDVGLGSIRSGHSMGLVSFREFDLSNSPSSRDRLIFTALTATFQCSVVRDGTSNLNLRQIAGAQTAVDFVDDGTGGYWMKFYNPSQVVWSPPIFTFTGSPWKTIHVESPGANQLKITETEGSASRVSLLALNAPPTLATGGTVTTSGSYTVHTFTSGGTFTANAGLSSVEALVVAGGGGGGAGLSGVMNAGGGGGGGVLYNSALGVSATAYSITVGAGGASGTNGGNSIFSSMTAVGGGHGASGAYAAPGASGGSGGGEGTAQGGGAGSGTSGQGYAGAAGGGASDYYGGGGGGANSSGISIVGGYGLPSTISGTLGAYGGGGGGGSKASSGGAGGPGGGGAGGGSSSYAGVNGTANTGGGGGGASQWSSSGGSGGSGIVIMRYPSAGAVTSGNYGWTLQEGDGTTPLRTTVHTSTQYSGYREDIAVVRTGGTSGTIVSKTKYRYENPGTWGEEVTQIVNDPDTAALTKTFVYNTNTANPGNYRRIHSVTDATGNWTAYTYYDDWDHRGQVQYEYHPYLDTPSTAASASTTTGRVVYYEYAADWTGRYNRTSLRQEKVNNVMTGKKVWTYDNSSNSPNWGRDKADVDSYRDGSNYHRDRIETIQVSNTEEGGEPAQIKGADLVHTVWNRSGGTYTSGVFTPSAAAVPNYRELVIHGTTSSAGTTAESAYDSQSFDTIYAYPNKSTMEVSIRDQAGNVIRTENRVYVGSSTWTLLNYENLTYDTAGRLTQRVGTNGATTDYTYTNGLLTSTVDLAGTETQFTYDTLWRVVTSVKKGASASGSYAAQGDITTTSTYDGASHVTQSVTSGSSLSLTAAAAYDLAGRPTSNTAPGSYTTSYGYTSGGKVVTTTLPGTSATKITEVYLDGQAKSVSGTAVVAEVYSYGVDSGTGKKYCQSVFGGNYSAWTNTYCDWLDRKIEEWKPQWDGNNYGKLWYYNSSNQLYKFSQPGMADSLYGYDTMGIKFLECLDINANGSIDVASNDRISRLDWSIGTWDSGATWWKFVPNYTYATSSSGTPTSTGYTTERLNNPSGYTDIRYIVDRYGNAIYHTTGFNRTNKILDSLDQHPDSSVTAEQVAYNGLLMSSRDTSNLTTTYGYDALGRQTTSVDPRKGTTTTAYVSGTNQVLSITDPASVGQAVYTYDSAGRVATVTNGLSKVSRFDYTNRNEKYHVWGQTDYPIEYGYNASGQMTTMSTFRGGSNWNASTWAGVTAGTADTTTWAYNATTNLLASKTDAASKTVSYTYTPSQQILTRSWARIITGTTHLMATYGYSSTTGELTGVSYNDGTTTGLTYTYNRLGQSATVVDASGTRTFNYNLAGTLELQNEDLPSYFGSRRVSYPIASSGVIGRSTGLQLGTSGSPTADQSITYGYDTYGRFNSLAGGGQTFAYGYAANSNLVSTVTDSAVGYTDTRTYNSTHDWVSDRKLAISSTTKAEFAYTPDNLGRTTKITKTGELFNRYGNTTQGLDTSYTYDDLSQVKSEQTKLGGSATLLTGRDDAYAYDTIGNRSSSSGKTHNSNAANYTTNALNQYSQRTVPGIFDVAGAYSGTGSVKVNGSSAGVVRQGPYFFDGYGLTNTAPYPAYSILAVNAGGVTTNVPAYVAPATELFTYDADGNLKSDGRWDYTYDAENRLITMETNSTGTSSVPTSLPKQKLTFAYDYLGRRVSKISQSGWTGSAYATTDYSLRFIYNGWNVMAVLNNLSSNAIISHHFWGLDIAGPGQTAGGVGAVLMTKEGSNCYLPIYDGNGNVHGLITAASVTLGGNSYAAGDIVAGYEYDAFGNTLRESGDYAGFNAFRYSTKFTDVETGLLYYGTRFYSPSMGRFINRDSIEEQGGLNLYAFCGNNGVNGYDVLGEFLWCPRAGIQEFGEGGSGGALTTGGGSMGLPSGVAVVTVNSEFDLTAGAGMSINSTLNAAAMVRNGASQADADRVARAYANNGMAAAENTAQQIDATHATAKAAGAIAASNSSGPSAQTLASQMPGALDPDGTPVSYGTLGQILIEQHDGSMVPLNRNASDFRSVDPGYETSYTVPGIENSSTTFGNRTGQVLGVRPVTGLQDATSDFVNLASFGVGGSGTRLAVVSGSAFESRMGKTAAEIIAKELKGSVNQVFPSEWKQKTLQEIIDAARAGNPSAQTARKLLTDGRFRK